MSDVEHVGLGDASTTSAPAGTNVVVNTSGVSWPAMFLIAAGALIAGGAIVYFLGPELGLEPFEAREEEEE